MATLFGKDYQTVDEILQQRSQERQAMFQDTRARNINAASNSAQFAGAGLGNLFGQAGVALFDKFFGKKATAATDPQLAAAEKMDAAATQIRSDIAKASNSPNASGYLTQAAQKAAELGREDIALQLSGQAKQAEQAELATQYQDIFRNTQQTVSGEVDPVKDPIKYNALMAERLGQSRNPLANQEANKYREQAINYQIDAAKAKAEAEGIEYDSPEGTEVTSASKFITSRMKADDDSGGMANGVNPLSESDVLGASVELASRAKDNMARNPKLTYNAAVAKSWSDMQQDGTIKRDDSGFWILKDDNYKYTPQGGGSTQATTPDKTEQVKTQASQVTRMVNGRRAIFDSETKDFIKWAD